MAAVGPTLGDIKGRAPVAAGAGDQAPSLSEWRGGAVSCTRRICDLALARATVAKIKKKAPPRFSRRVGSVCGSSTTVTWSGLATAGRNRPCQKSDARQTSPEYYKPTRPDSSTPAGSTSRASLGRCNEVGGEPWSAPPHTPAEVTSVNVGHAEGGEALAVLVRGS
jgi:hypothetical protein